MRWTSSRIRMTRSPIGPLLRSRERKRKSFLRRLDCARRLLLSDGHCIVRLRISRMCVPAFLFLRAATDVSSRSSKRTKKHRRRKRRDECKCTDPYALIMTLAFQLLTPRSRKRILEWSRKADPNSSYSARIKKQWVISRSATKEQESTPRSIDFSDRISRKGSNSCLSFAPFLRIRG